MGWNQRRINISHRAWKKLFNKSFYPEIKNLGPSDLLISNIRDKKNALTLRAYESFQFYHRIEVPTYVKALQGPTEIELTETIDDQ